MVPAIVKKLSLGVDEFEVFLLVDRSVLEPADLKQKNSREKGDTYCLFVISTVAYLDVYP